MGTGPPPSLATTTDSLRVTTATSLSLNPQPAGHTLELPQPGIHMPWESGVTSQEPSPGAFRQPAHFRLVTKARGSQPCLCLEMGSPPDSQQFSIPMA
ncbi:hypothetical protein P7K49_024790, partial [Saguinus oedipus]